MILGRRLPFLALALFVFATPALLAADAAREHTPTTIEVAQAKELLQETPLLFERNDGQYGNGFDFVSHAFGHTFLIHPSGALVNLQNEDSSQRTAQISLTFAGSRPDARPLPSTPSGGILNYYVGNDRAKWRSGIQSFERLRYSGVYDGIDVEYYGRGGELEYDLIVAPGADPGQIALRFDGARVVCIDHDGALVVESAAGELRHILPQIYQREADGTRTDVAGSFTLDDGKVGISLGAYDRSRELIIDPAILWSHQFLSGRLAVNSVAVDGSGNVFISGTMSNSTTYGGYDILPAGPRALDANPGFTSSAFVMGISSLKSVLFATYLGGSSSDTATAMVIANVSGSVGIYLLGQTSSDDFPTTAAAYQPLHVGGDTSFVAKLNTSGALLWATYLSGESNETSTGLAVDSTGSTYISGNTSSHTYPATHLDGTSLQGSGNRSGFVTKLNPEGTDIIYSTLFDTSPAGIALDETNAAYVVGTGLCTSVIKVAPTGGVLFENCVPAGTPLAIAVDSGHDIYLVGSAGAGLPVTPNAVQSTPGALSSGFYMRLDPTASTVKYATYLGVRNTLTDPVCQTYAVRIDGAGRAVMASTGLGHPTYLGFPYTTEQGSRILRFTTFNGLEFSTPVGGLNVIVPDTSNYIWAVSTKKLGTLRKAYVIIRKIDGTGSQEFSLLNVDQPARMVDVPASLTANAEFGYFVNGVQLSIDGTAATFTGLSVEAQPTQSFWTTPTVSAGVHSVSVVNGPYTSTAENVFEYVDEALQINSVTPSSIDSTATTSTVLTISGTGFAPEFAFSMNVPGSNPFQSYLLETYRVNKHTVMAVIPPGNSNAWAGTYDIQVGNAGGGPFYTKPAALIVTGTAISNIRGVGPTTGGTSLQFLQYQRTNSVSAASFDGIPAATFSSSPTPDFDIVTMTSPAHSLTGRVQITLTAPTGSYVLPNAFRYYQAISVTDVSPSTGSPLGGTPITITGTGFLFGARVFVGNVMASNVVVVSSTSITATTPAHVPGAVTVAVRNADGGWAKLTNGFTFNGPVITAVSPSTGPSGGGTSVVITLSGHDGTAAVYFGTTPAAVTNRTGTSITATTPAHAAGYVDVVVTNSTGDSGTRARAFRFTSIPQVDSFAPPSGGPGTSVVITGLRFNGTTRVAFGGIDASFVENSSTQLTATVPTGALTGPITVTAGLDTGTSSTNFGVPPRFAEIPFTPTNGVPGTSVTIAGANFQGTTQVTFNGTTAVFTVAGSGNSITATVPAAATTGLIAVITPLGTITTSTSFTVRPVIDSFTPTSASPGATVTISGARFTGATAVAFGGFAAASFNVVSSATITAVVGTIGGTGNITVTTPNGTATSSGTFTFTGPTISSFTPNKYSANPQTVVITGTNLSGATAVTFGGVAASGGFVVNSATQITATLTSNPQSGPIAITVGTATATSVDYFYGIPQINSFSPTSGAPGDIITINGNNFLGATQVGFGGTSYANSPSFTVVSNTRIDAMVPGFAATGTISVLTPYGFRTYSSASFTVTAAPPPTLWCRGVAGSSYIALSWTGAIQPYDVQRGPSAAGPWTTVGSNMQTLNALDNTTVSGNAYFYRVLRVGTPQISNIDFAVAYLFTDDPITAGSTVVKAVHLTQLRQAVNLMRVAAGLGNYSWTDGAPTGVPVKAVHINELRTAVAEAWTAIGYTLTPFTDPSLATGMAIKAVHINEMRNVVK